MFNMYFIKSLFLYKYYVHSILLRAFYCTFFICKTCDNTITNLRLVRFTYHEPNAHE